MDNDIDLIDADGHLLEPADLWERYIDPEFRNQTIRLETDADGREFMTLAGKRSAIGSRPFLISAGSMGMSLSDIPMLADARDRMLRGELATDKVGSYFDFPTEKTFANMPHYGAANVRERVDLLNQEGIAKALIYPTYAVGVPAEMVQLGMPDMKLAAAYFRAYNRWLVDACSESDGRLIPIALIDISDPDEAIRETRRAVAEGCKGVCIVPTTFTRVPHGHPDHDRFFAVVEDMDLPLAIHPNIDPPAWSIHKRFDNFEWPFFYHDMFANHSVQHAFATFFQFGVFDKFPRLRVVILESQAGWIGSFLDRADALFDHTVFAADVMLREKPSYYFSRQCFISADPDETTIHAIMPIVGEDKFFWASDYPHPDHPRDYVSNLKAMMGKMTPTQARKIASANVAREYRLN